MSTPLDIIENVADQHDWASDRIAHDELIIEVSGRWCDYSMGFIWNVGLQCLYFRCTLDMKIPANSYLKAIELIAKINSELTLGHFAVDKEQQYVNFYYTMLLSGYVDQVPANQQIDDLVTICLRECERFYPAIQYVLWAGKEPQEALQMSLIETAGEA